VNAQIAWPGASDGMCRQSDVAIPPIERWSRLMTLASLIL
jgi:hypothetical protein